MKERPLRFDLASAFSLSERVQHVCNQLHLLGHVVPVQWWDHTAEAHEAKAAPGTDDDFYALPSVHLTAARDFGGVTTCDALILVADDEPRKFNGANVELGYALALGKPCFALGRLDRSAMYAHVQRVASVEEVLAALGRPLDWVEYDEPCPRCGNAPCDDGPMHPPNGHCLRRGDLRRIQP